MERKALEKYLTVLADELGRKPGNLRFEHQKLFEGVDLEGRSVLDIGAGEGAASFYAASAGASRIASLEPEAAGSRSGAQERFDRIKGRLGADQVELRGETLQEFDPSGERFDVILSLASINHLDEEACIRLAHDPEARRKYGETFSKLAALANPGADLIVCDVSPKNFFARIERTNPITPTIEWEKHQPPELWAELLADAGFAQPRVHWAAFNILRRPGQVLLGNRVAAYFLTSGFCLTMKRLDDRG